MTSQGQLIASTHLCELIHLKSTFREHKQNNILDSRSFHFAQQIPNRQCFYASCQKRNLLAKCIAAGFPKERKMVTWDSEVEKDV